MPDQLLHLWMEITYIARHNQFLAFISLHRFVIKQLPHLTPIFWKNQLPVQNSQRSFQWLNEDNNTHQAHLSTCVIFISTLLHLRTILTTVSEDKFQTKHTYNSLDIPRCQMYRGLNVNHERISGTTHLFLI